jgi:hypothetical protein
MDERRAEITLKVLRVAGASGAVLVAVALVVLVVHCLMR